MQGSFLLEVANYLKDNHPDDADEVCIVFTNRRAKVFFRQELIKVNPQVQWLPDIFSTEDFVRELSKANVLDPVAAIFEFYKIYAELEGAEADSFELFSTWAPQLLHDYQEIDLYMVDARQLFGSVDAAYAMKLWSPDREELTAHQQQYLRFWARMGVWYEAYRRHLLDKNLLTPAMAGRLLAENIAEIAPTLNWKKIIFAGFNAINGAEKKIMNHLQKLGKAVFLWDSDPYYLNDEINEAGLFLRKAQRDWSFRTGKSFLRENPRKISIQGVSKNFGQALVAGGILNDLAKSNPDLSGTAVVLCDEQLLMPVLEALPENSGKVNITMGYPLHLLPAGSIFQLVFDMHGRMKLFSKKGRKEPAFYHRDVIRLIQNPLVSTLVNPEEAQRLILRIQKERHIFLSVNYLTENNSLFGKLQFLLDSWDNSTDKTLNCLENLIATLKADLDERELEQSGYEMEALFAASSLILRIKAWMKEFGDLMNVKTLHKIFVQLLRQETIPFYGEPLTGLQIMGLLETRNLDFRNVILLSVNEGVLPAAKVNRSFIPPDISNHFGLPGYRERDAVFAYHFYRLLQRAENVWLLYNTETDEFGKGEQSRFITQIEKELKTPHTEISRHIHVPQLRTPPNRGIRIQKTPKVLEELYKRFDYGISPSALSTFVNCSLQYYLRYLSNVQVVRPKDEEIGADLVGTVVHAVLENDFKPLKGTALKPGHIDAMMQGLGVKVRRQFVLEGVPERDLDYGKNLITIRTAEKMLSNFLRQHREEIHTINEQGGRLIVQDLEVELTRDIELKMPQGNIPVKFKGLADRIDQLSGKLRIVDYKTGMVEQKQLRTEGFQDVSEDPARSKVLQLLQYAFMVGESRGANRINPGIYSLRKPSEGFIEIQVDAEPGISPGQLQEIELIFRNLVRRMADPEEPFEQTGDWSRCKWCDFKEVCKR